MPTCPLSSLGPYLYPGFRNLIDNADLHKRSSANSITRSGEPRHDRDVNNTDYESCEVGFQRAILSEPFYDLQVLFLITSEALKSATLSRSCTEASGKDLNLDRFALRIARGDRVEEERVFKVLRTLTCNLFGVLEFEISTHLKIAL